MATRWHWGFRFLCAYMALSDAFDFGDLRHIHGSSVNTMALSMGNQPI
jgi:hypothetical protein